MLRQRARVVVGFILLWLAGVILCLAWLWRPADPFVAQDETYWIGSAYYYDLAFLQHDWSNPAWKLLPARENPPVAKYVVGLGLSAAGQRVATIDTLAYFYRQFENIPGAWGTGEARARRASVVSASTPGWLDRLQASGLIPVTGDTLKAARSTMMVCTVVASFLVLLLGAWTADWLTGLIASLLLMSHPVVVFSYNHVMSEAAALLFSTAAALAVYGWFNRISASARAVGPQMLMSVATGVTLGLACGAKMKSLVLVLFLGALSLLIIFRGLSEKKSRPAVSWVLLNFVVVVVVALLTFIIINPAIFQDVSSGLAATVSEHRQTEMIQAQFNPDHPVGFPQKAAAVARLTYLNWLGFIAIAMGVAWTAWKSRRQTGIQFLFCWWLIALASVVAWIPFAWPRYVLPLLVPSALLVGCASSGIATSIAEGIRRKSLRQQSAESGNPR
jgi:hypothetical protein